MFYYNYVNKCNEKGVSPTAAAIDMGFNRSMVTRWGNGVNPRQATLQKIADYFGCTVAELTKENPMPNSTGLPQEFVDMFNRLSAQGKADLDKYARFLLSQEADK